MTLDLDELEKLSNAAWILWAGLGVALIVWGVRHYSGWLTEPTPLQFAAGIAVTLVGCGFLALGLLGVKP